MVCNHAIVGPNQTLKKSFNPLDKSNGQADRPESNPTSIRWVKIFTWRANGDGIGLNKNTLLEGAENVLSQLSAVKLCFLRFLHSNPRWLVLCGGEGDSQVSSAQQHLCQLIRVVYWKFSSLISGSFIGMMPTAQHLSWQRLETTGLRTMTSLLRTARCELSLSSIIILNTEVYCGLTL